MIFCYHFPLQILFISFCVTNFVSLNAKPYCFFHIFWLMSKNFKFKFKLMLIFNKTLVFYAHQAKLFVLKIVNNFIGITIVENFFVFC